MFEQAFRNIDLRELRASRNRNAFAANEMLDALKRCIVCKLKQGRGGWRL
jgi:hypothetical protein